MRHRHLIRAAVVSLSCLRPLAAIAQSGELPPLRSAALPQSAAADTLADRPALAAGSAASEAPVESADMRAPATVRDAGRVFGPVVPPAVSPNSSQPQLDWTFAPTTVPYKLSEAISQASQHNPAIAAAWFAVRASNADLRSAKWRRFPTLSAQVNTWSRGANRSLPSLQLGLPIYTFGRINAGINKAEAEQALAVSAWRQRVLDTASTVSQTYYQYLLSVEREAILAEGVAEHEKLVASMERRVAQEVSPLADLELARGRTAQIQQELNIAAAQRSTSLSILRELIQNPEFDPGSKPEFDRTAFIEGWENAEQEALDYDPARERLRAQAQAASYEISAAKASIFPQVDAVYSYDEVFGSRVGLALKVQSAPGLSQLAQVSSAQARYSQALSQVGDLERQLRQDIASQVIQYRAALVRGAISSQASFTAGRVSGSYVRQFIAGRRSWLDVMNAVRENISARLSETDAKFTVMSTNSQLYLRTGKWQPQIQEGGK